MKRFRLGQFDCTLEELCCKKAVHTYDLGVREWRLSEEKNVLYALWNENSRWQPIYGEQCLAYAGRLLDKDRRPPSHARGITTDRAQRWFTENCSTITMCDNGYRIFFVPRRFNGR